MVLVGHHCAMTGRHRLALGEYFRAYRRMPSNALLSLLIGCTYLQKVLSRRCPNSHEYVMRAFTFLFQYQSAAWAHPTPPRTPFSRSFFRRGARDSPPLSLPRSSRSFVRQSRGRRRRTT
jgi:hypothetical protein